MDKLIAAKEQIRLRADIAVVAGRYVNLKPNGQVMKGLCPFHNEKTPSFTVNPSKNVFYCFGCGKGGDIFRFLQEIENMDFREAVETLARETGVELPQKPQRENRHDSNYYHDDDADYSGAQKSTLQKNDLIEIHNIAAAFFYRTTKNSPQAIDYFKGRGLKAETVKEFTLGYAPSEWSALLDHLRAQNIPQEHIAASGLVVTKENGSAYDRFRDRIMFPLCDLSGQVVAFAGRGLNADTQPKYLNSPETLIYQKSRMLYGLHKARKHIRETETLLLVEGYMDYLTLWQNKICNVAAVSGTALTEDHAHLVKRYASKVVLMFDGDSAGLRAAKRSAFIFAPLNIQVEVFTFPKGDDPDSFVKREGAEAFKERLASASIPAAKFLIDNVADEFDDGSPYGKSRAAGELAPYARMLKDPIVRDDFLSLLARRLRVDRALVARKIGNVINGGDARIFTDGIADKRAGATPAAINKTIGKLEEDFLRIIITAPELIPTARQYINHENFSDTLSANVYSIILENYERSGNLFGLMDAAQNSSELSQIIPKLAAMPARLDNIQEELVQKILLLRKKFLKAQIKQLSKELAFCTDDTDKNKILEEIKKCGDLLKELD